MAVFISTINISAEYLRHGNGTVISEFFNEDYDSAEALKAVDEYWFHPGIIATLTLAIIAKFIITILSISCPFPVGIVTPCLTIGCLIGRWYGEILRMFFSHIIHIGGFALVGAASFTACVTRTTSVAIIIFELSGQLEFMPHLLFGVLVSYSIGNWLQPSFLDILLQIKRLPYLPALLSPEAYTKTAQS